MQTPQRISSNYPKVLESYKKKENHKQVTEKKYDWKSTKHSNQHNKNSQKNRPSSDSYAPHLCIGFRFPPRWAWTTARHRGSGASEAACQWSNATPWFIPYKHTSITSLLLLYVVYSIYIYIGYDINISFRFITYCIAPKKVDPSLGHVQIFTNGSTKSTNHQKWGQAARPCELLQLPKLPNVPREVQVPP